MTTEKLHIASIVERATSTIAELLCRRSTRQIEEYQALTRATVNNNVAVVKDLLAWGISPNPPRFAQEGTTPFSYAIKAGSAPIARLLLKAGAVIQWEINGVPLLSYTLQSKASPDDKAAICRLLIKAGASVSHDDLRQATRNHDMQVVRLLLGTQEKWGLELPLEDLQALAAVNPYSWDELTQDELDGRIARATLGLLRCRPTVPSPGIYGNRGNGKTVVTRAVLERLAADEPDLFLVLDRIQQGEPENIGERLVFERLEEVAMERLIASRREVLSELAQISQTARPTATAGETRRAM